MGLFAYYVVGLPISFGTGFGAGWGLYGLWSVSTPYFLILWELQSCDTDLGIRDLRLRSVSSRLSRVCSYTRRVGRGPSKMRIGGML